MNNAYLYKKINVYNLPFHPLYVAEMIIAVKRPSVLVRMMLLNHRII